jgi:hypothetical protein
MAIYIDGRMKNELDELLKAKPAESVTARDLYGLATMHYLDDEPMTTAAAFFELDDPSKPHKVLDFGAGFAGDARLMATEFPSCEITCVECQTRIHTAVRDCFFLTSCSLTLPLLAS